MQIIEKMPVPKSKTGTWKRERLYKYAELKVGECIFVIGKRRGNSAAAAARTWGAKHGCKFVSRLDGDGVYVCRVK
jgi:hypothetical protein